MIAKTANILFVYATSSHNSWSQLLLLVFFQHQGHLKVARACVCLRFLRITVLVVICAIEFYQISNAASKCDVDLFYVNCEHDHFHNSFVT
jgi:hypothetical protein